MGFESRWTLCQPFEAVPRYVPVQQKACRSGRMARTRLDFCMVLLLWNGHQAHFPAIWKTDCSRTEARGRVQKPSHTVACTFGGDRILQWSRLGEKEHRRRLQQTIFSRQLCSWKTLPDGNLRLHARQVRCSHGRLHSCRPARLRTEQRGIPGQIWRRLSLNHKRLCEKLVSSDQPCEGHRKNSRLLQGDSKFGGLYDSDQRNGRRTL